MELQSELEGRRWLERLGYAAGGLLLFVVAWFCIGQILFTRPSFQQFSDMLPLPSLKALAGLFVDPRFWISVAASLRRVTVGILFALVIGLPAGLCIGFFRRLRELTNTPIQLLRMISPLAYDSGGVTTSTVTVPLVTALGMGLASTVPGRSVLIDGFGLIAFASLFPMITVMGYAQLSVLRARRARRRRY